MKTRLARVEAREKALNDIRVMKAKRPFLEFDVKEEAFNAAKARFEEAKAKQKVRLCVVSPFTMCEAHVWICSSESPGEFGASENCFGGRQPSPFGPY